MCIQYHILAHSHSLLFIAPEASNAINRLDRSIRIQAFLLLISSEDITIFGRVL